MAITKIERISNYSKDELFELALEQITAFAELNKIVLPYVNLAEASRLIDDISYGCCRYIAFNNTIEICLPRCANTGNGGRLMSSPGSKIDRTPFGVISHEMGHCVHAKVVGERFSYDDLKPMRRLFVSPRERISGYEPNYREGFAESMRLFINNPDLLKSACPERYSFIADKVGLKPIYDIYWETMLAERGTHPKIIVAVTNWVAKQKNKVYI